PRHLPPRHFPSSPVPPSRSAALLATALLAAAGLTACGADVEDTPQDRNITVTNCGVTQTYPRPQHPVAYDVSAIEKMFSLGLADQMRGIVMPKTVNSAIGKSPYHQDYHSVETISDQVLGQEAIVNAKADWVFAGWQAGFSQERGVTPQSLDKLGIHSYMQEETCYNYGAGGTKEANPAAPDQPIEAMYQDLHNLGEIFGVQDRAEKLVRDLRDRERSLHDKVQAIPAAERQKVFVYDSGTDEPYTAGRRAALNSVIDLAGGRSVTGDVDARFTTVGWESIVTAEPDAVVVIDYNKQPVADKINYLRTQSPIKDTPAVKNNRIYVIDYGEAVSNPRNIEAAEKLAGFLAGK
ncbi:ABC transporter substrate-binding protein, partial [Corynebacterium heidelbergense]